MTNKNDRMVVVVLSRRGRGLVPAVLVSASGGGVAVEDACLLMVLS